MRWWRNAVEFYLGGMGYVGLELLWRQWSHGSMFVVGGISFLLLGWIGTEFSQWGRLGQAVLGAAAVTGIEFVSGVVINLVLGLGVWDYSALPYSVLGQVCPQYFLLWIPVCAAAMWLYGALGTGLWGESKGVFMQQEKRSGFFGQMKPGVPRPKANPLPSEEERGRGH